MILLTVMEFWYRIRQRLGGLVAPTVCTLGVVYFGYHAVQGDRGLIAYAQLGLDVSRVEAELALIREQRKAMERKVALLHPDHIDPDMLDQQARLILGLAHPDELVVFQK